MNVKTFVRIFRAVRNGSDMIKCHFVNRMYQKHLLPWGLNHYFDRLLTDGGWEVFDDLHDKGYKRRAWCNKKLREDWTCAELEVQVDFAKFSVIAERRKRLLHQYLLAVDDGLR